MDSTGDWFIPGLSLQRELEMECDRRAAAHLSSHQLAGKIDELIQAWYVQDSLINQMLGKIRELEAKLALADPPMPANQEPERNVEMARELLWGRHHQR